MYFIKSNDKQDVIYDRANGITTSLQALTDIANEFCLSRERIRQIVSRYSPSSILGDIMPLLDSHYYSFLNNDFIDPTDVYSIISKMEFAQPNEFSEYALVGILSLSKGLKPLILGKKTLLISTTTFDSFDFGASIKDMSNMLLSKTTEDVTLPINIFINNYILNSRFNYKKIENIIIYIVKSMFKVDIDQHNNILLKRNSIDVEDEFFKILENNGTPLSFDELCSRLLDLHPTMSYAPGTLRSFLFNSNRITAIGKTSTYTLKKWNISHLTIRGLIHQILEESDTPLSLDDIVDFLAIKGRITNRNSVNSNILLDNKYHFVKFENGLIGIESKKYATSYIQTDLSYVSRRTFHERIVEFLDYIDTYHHIPFASSDVVEASLHRWYNNVIKGVLYITDEQKKYFESELSKRKEYIMTSSEFSFIERCKDYKYFVSSRYDLPTLKTDALLYNWFSKARKKLFKFTPKKEKAYNDLIRFLSDYGFYIED